VFLGERMKEGRNEKRRSIILKGSAAPLLPLVLISEDGHLIFGGRSLGIFIGTGAVGNYPRILISILRLEREKESISWWVRCAIGIEK
jgi:hypothetical protein